MVDYSIDIIKDTSYTIELNEQGPQGIQGERGMQGPQGPAGPKGDKGDSALTFTVGETIELPTGNSAYVENVGTNQNIVLNFGIPRGLTGPIGPQGPQGPKGDSAFTLSIGEVNSVSGGSPATITNIGTQSDQVWDIDIPAGKDGGMGAVYVDSTGTLDLFRESGTYLQPRWGYITGDIANQLDLQNALSTKVTETEVAQMIASIPQFEMKIVDSLPSQGQKMVLYLVPKTSAGGDDIYDEYIWLESTSSFELIGSTTVDLSDYYTKTETNELIPTKTSQLINNSGFVTQDSLLEKTSETWTFTLEDGTEVTKTMVLGA